MNATENNKFRAGRYLQQSSGYRAFIPAPLPPDPPVDLMGKLRDSLSSADYTLGRLDGAILTLPNPDLFVFMYVRKEAVLSSQIEGTKVLFRTCLLLKRNSSDLYAKGCAGSRQLCAGDE
jgi:Fic family protein